MLKRSLFVAWLLLPGASGRVPAAPWQLADAAVDADQAAAMARAQTGGRVLGVDWDDSGEGPTYLVRVLMPDGSIRVVTVEAVRR